MCPISQLGSILFAVSIAIGNAVDHVDITHIFVSRSGKDHPSCGTQADSCGTLFMASKIIRESFDWTAFDWTTRGRGIYVIDGQNETQIDGYHTFSNTNTYDPCVPIPFQTSYDVSITFDDNMITNLLDWYPLHICQNHSLSYHNEYMFEGGRSLTINNLIINDYAITDANDTYSIIRSVDYYNASILCNNCTFRNVTSTIYEFPLIHSISSIRLHNNRFSQIQSDGNNIFADHYANMDYATRHITIHQTLFQDISSESIVNVKRSSNDQGDYVPHVYITSCTFVNISTTKAIITDNAISCYLVIKDTKIDVVSGSIYHAKHTLASTIHISNISVTSNQLTTLSDDGLLHVCSFDTAYMKNVDILYSYNTSKSCAEVESDSNSVLNTTYAVLECTNPIKAIHNFGYVLINDITVNIDLFPPKQNYGQLKQYAYEREDVISGFIINSGIMYITSMIVKHLICHSLIINQYILSIESLSLDYINYDPNSLHSYSIIYQDATISDLYIKQSRFYGAELQIDIAASNKIEICNSIFQFTGRALVISQANQVSFKNCTTKNIGTYFGPLVSDTHLNQYATAPIQIWWSDDIVFSNNHISGLDRLGLLYLSFSSNVIVIGNEFQMNPSNLLYNVSLKHIGSEYRFQSCDNSSNHLKRNI
eukprot:203121_1